MAPDFLVHRVAEQDQQTRTEKRCGSEEHVTPHNSTASGHVPSKPAPPRPAGNMRTGHALRLSCLGKHMASASHCVGCEKTVAQGPFEHSVCIEGGGGGSGRADPCSNNLKHTYNWDSELALVCGLEALLQGACSGPARDQKGGPRQWGRRDGGTHSCSSAHPAKVQHQAFPSTCRDQVSNRRNVKERWGTQGTACIHMHTCTHVHIHGCQRPTDTLQTHRQDSTYPLS
jgi:hypothetical protein